MTENDRKKFSDIFRETLPEIYVNHLFKLLLFYLESEL